MSRFSEKILIAFQLVLVTVAAPLQLIQIKPGSYLIDIKFFNNQYNNGTVSKFPPIIEYFVQRIQAQNSNYVHEDLSRPPTYDKPVYTLSPSEQLTAYQPLVVENVTEAMIPASTTNGNNQQLQQEDTEVKTTTTDRFEYEELEETTEKFYEIISPNGNRRMHSHDVEEAAIESTTLDEIENDNRNETSTISTDSEWVTTDNSPSTVMSPLL